jgi:hypothetical protein
VISLCKIVVFVKYAAFAGVDAIGNFNKPDVREQDLHWVHLPFLVVCLQVFFAASEILKVLLIGKIVYLVRRVYYMVA